MTTHLIWYPGHERLVDDIVRAEGVHLFDASGKRYVDLESGVWCTAVGHGHPRLLAVMAAQAAAVAHTGFSYSHRLVEDAAAEVMALLGFEGGECVFLCSGSEAVEYGVRVARMVVERPRLLTMADSYFGAYGSARERQERDWYTFDWRACAAAGRTTCDPNCEHFAAIPFATLGGFLFEPGSASGLVRFPPAELVRAIADRIQGDGGLVLVNEVTTGVGRTGRWFGFEHYPIAPDVVAIGKGIGNGYPVSIAAFSPGVRARRGDRPVAYAQSHQNDPLGAAVAREVVRIIRDGDLIARARDVGDRLESALRAIAARTARIREIRSRGLMLAIELDDDPPFALTTRVHRSLVDRGFVVGRRPGVSVLRLDPSLTIERVDVEAFLEAFESVLAATPSG